MNEGDDGTYERIEKRETEELEIRIKEDMEDTYDVSSTAPTSIYPAAFTK